MSRSAFMLVLTIAAVGCGDDSGTDTRTDCGSCDLDSADTDSSVPSLRDAALDSNELGPLDSGLFDPPDAFSRDMAAPDIGPMDAAPPVMCSLDVPSGPGDIDAGAGDAGCSEHAVRLSPVVFGGRYGGFDFCSCPEADSQMIEVRVYRDDLLYHETVVGCDERGAIVDLPSGSVAGDYVLAFRAVFNPGFADVAIAGWVGPGCPEMTSCRRCDERGCEPATTYTCDPLCITLPECGEVRIPLQLWCSNAASAADDACLFP